MAQAWAAKTEAEIQGREYEDPTTLNGKLLSDLLDIFMRDRHAVSKPVPRDTVYAIEQLRRELSLKPIFLHPIMAFGVKAKFTLGAEWIKDLGDSGNETGTGSDQIAPLTGIGWLFTKEDFVITLVQYFHSYDEDSGFDDVRKHRPAADLYPQASCHKGLGQGRPEGQHRS